MALSKTAVSPCGFEAVDAYHRVESIQFIGKNILMFQLSSYKTLDLPRYASTGYQVSYDLDGPNPIKQAYLHLKTLPEFADAIDC